MRVRITLPASVVDRVREELNEHLSQLENETFTADTATLVYLIDPGLFRQFDEFVRNESNGAVRSLVSVSVKGLLLLLLLPLLCSSRLCSLLIIPPFFIFPY